MPDGSPTSRRLAWLDALRAVAVLLVLYAHLTRHVFTGARAVTSEWLHAGTAGVMLFFLVSGYIIPASLERHGDLRRFWVGRIRRLWPLYTVVAVVAAVLNQEISLGQAAAHATMLPFFLGVELITPVFWTLSFEMLFYLLVSALFKVRSRWTPALAGGILAVLGVVTAPLPLLGGADGSHAWDALLILAVMFTGAAIYRADTGETSWWPVLITASLVSAALLTNWFAELRSLDALTLRYMARSVITLLVFGGAFALGMAVRRRRIPAWLARIGVISYSIYLVHYVLLQQVGPHLGGPIGAVLFLVGLVAVCELTYRWIELPGQRLGRSAKRRHLPRQRAGSDQESAGAPSISR